VGFFREVSRVSQGSTRGGVKIGRAWGHDMGTGLLRGKGLVTSHWLMGGPMETVCVNNIVVHRGSGPERKGRTSRAPTKTNAWKNASQGNIMSREGL